MRSKKLFPILIMVLGSLIGLMLVSCSGDQQENSQQEQEETKQEEPYFGLHELKGVRHYQNKDFSSSKYEELELESYYKDIFVKDESLIESVVASSASESNASEKMKQYNNMVENFTSGIHGSFKLEEEQDEHGYYFATLNFYSEYNGEQEMGDIGLSEQYNVVSKALTSTIISPASIEDEKNKLIIESVYGNINCCIEDDDIIVPINEFQIGVDKTGEYALVFSK